MFDKSATRVEKLIPDYGKLKFVNKEEKQREDELTGFSENDILVWRQLESQAYMANEQLEKTSDIFQKWLDDYEDMQDMVVVQKALNVMNTFGRLLLALDTERQFLLSNKKVEIKEVEVERPGKEIYEKFSKKKIALFLCGERGFDSGGKGRGKVGTYQIVAKILGIKDKKTIETWIDELIEKEYVGNIIKNFKELLEEKGKMIEISGEDKKAKAEPNKNDLEVLKNEKEVVETL